MSYRSRPFPTTHGAAPAPRGPLVRRAALAVLCAVVAGCGQAQGEEAPRGLLGELARELDGAPPIAPRLSISGAEGPCIAPDAHPAAAEGTRCADLSASADAASRVAAIAVRAERVLREGADAQAMHTAALIDLLYDGGGGKRLHQSISSLQALARLSDRPAPVLADLAAAYLVRAERAGSPRDLAAAVEAAEQALERDPEHGGARYNLALALQRLGLMEEAAQAWRQYLAADSASAWARAARSHLRQAPAAAAAPPPPGAPPSAFAAYAAADPQGARELGWGLLGAWGRAVQAADTAGAARSLTRAEALGHALARRPGGDATLWDGVRAIRTVRPGVPLRRLARAHAELAAGYALEKRAEFRGAAPRFAAAAAHAADSPALQSWARLMSGSVAFHSGDARAGERIFRDVARTADSLRHPALAGRARVLLAAVQLRGDRYEPGLADAARAARLFARAGERENEGAALDGASIAHFFLRDMDRGYALAHRALERLGPYRGSYRLHNLLSFTAEIIAEDGFTRAAVRMQDEGVRVAARTGNPIYLVEARLTRARLLAAAGRPAAARGDLDAVRQGVARLADPEMRGWMTAQRQMAEAATSLRTDPARAGAALDSAAAFLLEMNAPIVALPAVVAGAQARLVAGDASRGTALLLQALSILEQRRDSIRMEPRRAAVFETARSVVDRVAMLRLASGDTAGALGVLDRGRASLAPVASSPGRGEGDGDVTGPTGEVALEYALVADTLLIWTIAGRDVQLFRTVVDTAHLADEMDRLRRRLERGEDPRAGLAWLHERLVRPVQERLGPAGTPLVVITDGELASLPFAAAYDARRTRYLVESHPIRFAASLRDARRQTRRGAPPRPALFVADPAFDRAGHPGLDRLPQAAREVGEIAAGYAGAEVLAQAEADREAVRGALGRAGLVHYAGHAAFDDERPERSYLLLASTPGQRGTGMLTAAEIAQLDLRHVRLVVLAACQTIRTGRGRAAGFSGLAGAFLAAGAGGAVGSLWEVDDRLTRRLLTEFHDAYRASGNGPGALRDAQIRLLRSDDASLRSPSAWAGFRFAGN